jgi:hypothetical protein
VAQCSGGHFSLIAGGAPGNDLFAAELFMSQSNLTGQAFRTDKTEALLNLQVFVNNSDQSVVDYNFSGQWPLLKSVLRLGFRPASICLLRAPLRSYVVLSYSFGITKLFWHATLSAF